MKKSFFKFKNNPLQVIFFTVFVDMLRFGILIPILPELLANPRSPHFLLPSGATISQGYILLGFLTATFPLAQFLATPILGELSDFFGRRKILTFSLAGTFISYLIFAYGILTRNLPLLFISRAVDGITGGNISVAQAAIADITPPDKRAKNFGLVGAAFGLGFILGPYLGGKLSDPSIMPWFDATTPFWFAAILSLFNTLFVLTNFPETLKNAKEKLEVTWLGAINNIFEAFSQSTLRPLFLTSMLFQGGFTFFSTFFSVYLIRRFNFSQGAIGDFFSYMGLWIVFTQAFVIRRAANRFAEYQILRITLFGVAGATLLYMLPRASWQLLFIVPIMAICNGLTNANLTALISRLVKREVQGEILGIHASVQAFAQAIPPVISGYIAAGLTPETPIIVATGTLLAGWLLFVLLFRPVKAVLVT